MQIIEDDTLLEYCDYDYREAVNARSLYNPPITFNYGGFKYIIGAGSKDDITIFKDGDMFYVMSQNPGLGYIGLDIIDTTTQTFTQGPFFQGWEADDKMELDLKDQLETLLQYTD